MDCVNECQAYPVCFSKKDGDKCQQVIKLIEQKNTDKLKKMISVEDVCSLLNEMLLIDYECVHTLVSHRVQCNKGIADHPTIQVQQLKDDEFPKVGLLGFLNGLFGIREDGMGSICMEIDNGKILNFKPTPSK